LIAFGVFIVALLGKLKLNNIYIYIYKERKFNIKNFVIFALPGMVFVVWYLYVTVRFNAFPFSQAEDITQFFLTAWPSFFLNAIQNGKLCEILGLLLYLLIIITALFFSVFAGKVNKLFYSITPYVILVGSFGPIVMANYAGYLKGSSILFFLLPVMYLSFKEKLHDGEEKSSKFGIVLSNVTVMLMFFSVAVSASCVSDKVLSTKVPQDLNQTDKTAIVDEVKPLEDFAASLDIITYDYKAKCNIPLASVFVEDYAICDVEIKNQSVFEWQNVMQPDGSGFLAVTYRWYKKSDTAFEQCVLEGNRTAVGKEVKPEESLYRKMYVEYPKESGDYILRISLIQEGYAWFYQYDRGYVDIPVIVK
ncbi:MAG: hypothetical protein K2P76_13240, partial [Lachnospiraceae bacterium]|nr:hypothetical protein [Lachnospiraceae bacterium]